MPTTNRYQGSGTHKRDMIMSVVEIHPAGKKHSSSAGRTRKAIMLKLLTCLSEAKHAMIAKVRTSVFNDVCVHIQRLIDHVLARPKNQGPSCANF